MSVFRNIVSSHIVAGEAPIISGIAYPRLSFRVFIVMNNIIPLSDIADSMVVVSDSFLFVFQVCLAYNSIATGSSRKKDNAAKKCSVP